MQTSKGISVSRTLLLAILVVFFLGVSGFFGWLDRTASRIVLGTHSAAIATTSWISETWKEHFARRDAVEHARALEEELAKYRFALQLQQQDLDQYKKILALQQPDFNQQNRWVHQSQLVFRNENLRKPALWTRIPDTFQTAVVESFNVPLTGPHISAIGPEGLVGRVDRIVGKYGRILPLAANGSAYDVRLGNYRGIFYGQGIDGTGHVRFVPRAANIVTGTTVHTGGDDGLAPAGITVGVVTNIVDLDDGLNIDIEVTIPRYGELDDVVWLAIQVP